MARFKPARGKAKAESNMPRAGLPCLVLVVLVIVLTLALMYYALKSSGS
jgi:hypothetical protein